MPSGAHHGQRRAVLSGLRALPIAAGAEAVKVRLRPSMSLSVAVFALGLVSACGSSRAGADASCADAAPRVVPTSSDMAPHVGELVTLGAAPMAPVDAGACDAPSDAWTYAWMLTAVPAESHASLNAPSVVAPSFVVDAPGEYVARVVATAASGDASAPAEIRIEAGNCGANPPVVSLVTSAPATPVAGDTVTLGASVTDADTDAPCDAPAEDFGYAWAFSDLPPGSRATLNDAHIEHPSFAADVAGTYALELVVSDATGRHGTASVTVDVSAASDDGGASCGSAAPVAAAWRVVPGPVVDCSVPSIATDLAGTNKIMLDAVPSSDPDNLCGANQALDYHWTLLATPLAGGSSRLESTDGRATVLDVASEGEYQVRLVVTDSTGRQSPELLCTLYAYDLP
jgi:hypothetical protein